MLELDQLRARIQTVRDMSKIQCEDGNWNYSSYMRGLANGLIAAVAALDGEAPEFKDELDGELQIGIRSYFRDFCDWIEMYRGAQVYVLDEDDEMVVACPRFDLMYEDFQASWKDNLDTSDSLRRIQRGQRNILSDRFRTDWRIRIVSWLGVAVMRLGLRIHYAEMRMRKCKVIEVKNG